MKKFLHLISILTMILPLGLSLLATSITANAEDIPKDSPVGVSKVTIHKRLFNTTPAYTQNTGELMNDFGGTPLKDAEFTAYDVTAAYHSLITANKDKTNPAQAAVNEIVKNSSSYTSIKVGSSQVTGEDGIATFDGLLEKKDGLDAAYLFLETKVPTLGTDQIITEAAQPMVITMPVYALAADGTYTDKKLNDIHLYPKNVSKQNTKTLLNDDAFDDVEFTLGDKTYNYYNVSTGDVLNYQLKINIPANIGDANHVKSFVIKDTPDNGLALTNPSKIEVVGLTKEVDYTLKEQDGGFEISLVLTSEKVKDLANKELHINYDMKLTKEITPDQGKQNNAGIVVNNNPEIDITPPKGVVTGGKQFKKTDAQTNNALAGAEFKVKSLDEKFAKFEVNSKGEYAFVEWTDEASATNIVSGNDGLIKVIGLAYGNYKLIETKAPTSEYVKIDGEINFIVTKEAYNDEDDLQVIANTHKGLLPQTGGVGIYAFLAIGIALMVGAMAWSKRNKEDAEV
ncbi:MAG: SpaH/EbpB family LPXTG-anchored major pilin [Streptococcaceae bacterium]|jgi:fimbrial isopeptide formation D2 family protein/LPXTG-motif cell wall-anchored protein|nr:SpaH/EbpB family LPXTG-anchored major pilin [Streptococcaceae bacterium]